MLPFSTSTIYHAYVNLDASFRQYLTSLFVAIYLPAPV